MASITRLQPHQHIRTTVGELDAFLADAEDRRGLSANTITSYRCDLLAVGTVLTCPLDRMALGDIGFFLAAGNESRSTRTGVSPACANSFVGRSAKAIAPIIQSISLIGGFYG